MTSRPPATLTPIAPPASASGLSRRDRVREALLRTLGRDRCLAAVGVYRLARGKELRAPYPLTEKLTAWRRGFRTEHAKLYDFVRNDWREYVSDYQRIHRCVNINPAPELFANKLFLKTFLAQRGIAQAETAAVVSNGRILLDPLGPLARYVTGVEFERWLIEDGGRFIVKPHDGTKGEHIYMLLVEDGRLVKQRGLRRDPFRAELGGNTLIVERMVEQGAFWRELSPASCNTIRALTMWTPGDDEPFLGFAVQRMGTENTAPTDNWSGGGICARIDLQTGRLGLGRMHPLKGDRPQTTFTTHPDSGARIEGATIPHWQRVRDTVLRAAASLPTNRYVGWDVIVDEAGTPVIIEGNSNTDVNLLQVHGGLLVDPLVRRFYERCGVL